jgi:hypothetical protein
LNNFHKKRAQVFLQRQRRVFQSVGLSGPVRSKLDCRHFKRSGLPQRLESAFNRPDPAEPGLVQTAISLGRWSGKWIFFAHFAAVNLLGETAPTKRRIFWDLLPIKLMASKISALQHRKNLNRWTGTSLATMRLTVGNSVGWPNNWINDIAEINAPTPSSARELAALYTATVGC